MKSTWMTWLLAGALAASLQWNFRHARDAAPAYGTPCAGTVDECELDPAALGLRDEQRRALETLCRTQCRQVDELQTRAEATLGELRRRLSDPTASDATIDRLVDDVSALRQRALEGTVDSIRGVRGILNDEQLAALVAACCPVDLDEAPSCTPSSAACGSATDPCAPALEDAGRGE